MNKEDESHLKFLGVHAEVIEFMKNQQNINKMELLTAKEAREISENLNPEINKLFGRILNEINETAKNGEFQIIVCNNLFDKAMACKLNTLGYEIIERGTTIDGIRNYIITW
jgi:hypothetical protein